MSPQATNTATLGVLLAPWMLFFVWEVYVLIRRAKDVHVKTISMVALDRGHHLSSVVYLWGGMAAHWWWPSEKFAPVWAGILFWTVLAPLLAHDIGRWGSDAKTWTWERWVFHPMPVLAAGFVAGKLLFPQAG